MNSNSRFIQQFSKHFKTLILASCVSLPGCVVVPDKTTSYDYGCNMDVSTVGLGLAFVDDGWYSPYDHWNFSEEVSSATFLLATSAIVSGSIAVAGNAFYHLENKLACVSDEQLKEYARINSSQSQRTLNEYVIEEEVVTAKF